jgi:glycogen debranching enzyme
MNISYEYTPESWRTFAEGRSREWAMTNGIGGYAGSSLIGAHTRTHQGYLIASLHPPIQRYLVFSRIDETITVDAGNGVVADYPLTTAQRLINGHTVCEEGQKFLTHFSYDGSIHYTYQAGAISIQKHIALKQGENVCAVAYEIENHGADAALTLLPQFNFREHSQLTPGGSFHFSILQKKHRLLLLPQDSALPQKAGILFQISEGDFRDKADTISGNYQLQTEVELETEGLDAHYCPKDILIALPAGCRKKISVLCSVLTGTSFDNLLRSMQLPCDAAEELADSAFQILEERHAYLEQVLSTAGYRDDFACRLTLAADQFLCHRNSTGLKTILAGLPWFTDWGRDTMIAFTGLTLCTGRKKEAKEILLTFARYIKNGIVPNMFPDNDAAPLYNTADASLWYFYAVWQYLAYTGTPEDYAFIKEEIYPHLKEIIHAYRHGTDFQIYMDTDGLIHAGSGLDQITWMDVRVDDWVPTPRHGKPVEINALWYNALKVMAALASYFGDDSSAAEYEMLSSRTKTSFCEKFWNPDLGYLYDVLGDDAPDSSLRPNQIYAVSLPFTMLSERQNRSIVEIVEKELYTGCGLRSLAPDHADYHPIYCGALSKRDAAYHQGTSWGFLLGGFLSAYLKVHHHSPESIRHARELLVPVQKHLWDDGCIGSISEIFDGDAPHTPRGCYAQAWSVGEILRAYTEDILGAPDIRH